MKYLNCLVLVLLFGCRVDNHDAVGPEWSNNAFIYDSSMYADGCELHLQLDSDNPPNTGPQYLPTAASLPLIKHVIAESAPDPRAIVRIPVTIRFRETTHRRIVSCGWVSPTVTEIDVLAINRR